MTTKDFGAPQGPADVSSDRWWVDSEGKIAASTGKAGAPVGSRFFVAAEGYDQDRAHANLTNFNVRLLELAEPPSGGWGYVSLTERPCPDDEMGKLKRRCPLPAYARGVVVDCNGSLRLLITGTPLGKRVLELSLSEEPAFDCWVDGEWVAEALFPSEEQGLAGLRAAVKRYLSPDGEKRQFS